MLETIADIQINNSAFGGADSMMVRLDKDSKKLEVALFSGGHYLDGTMVDLKQLCEKEV